MFSILAKEIRSFLSSLIAIIVIIVFLIANGLFIWIFNETNILEKGLTTLLIEYFFHTKGEKFQL